MTDNKKQWLIRLLLGGAAGLILHFFWGYAGGSLDPFGPAAFHGFKFYFGAWPGWLGTSLGFLLWAAFGAEAAAATLPFAEEGRALLRRSLLHFFTMALTLSLWAGLNFCGRDPVPFLRWDLPQFLIPFTLIYILIWLARWVGWYAEAAAIRKKLGLTAAVSEPPMARRALIGWLPAALAVTALVWACNLGAAWWSSNVKWYHTISTLVYIIFWCAFTRAVRGRGRPGMFLLAVSLLHLLSALSSLLARLTLKGPLPAALSAPFALTALLSPFPAGVVFFGLLPLTGRAYTAFFALTAVLSAAWAVWNALLICKHKLT